MRVGDVDLTYAQLLGSASGLARYLMRNGLESGDRVGIYMPNRAEWVPAWTGILQAGGTAVPMNVLLSPTAMRHVITDSAMKWLIVQDEDVTSVRGVVDDVAPAVELISMTPTEGAATSVAELGCRSDQPVVPRLDDDDAMIMYTSGSTGVPKGVRQTHRNTTAQCEAVQLTFDIDENDHALISTPLFHVGGLQLITLPVLLAGGVVTLMSRWDKHEWMNQSLAARPTVAALVPTMMIDVANAYAGKQIRLDSYRVCMIGGSALPDGPVQRFTEATGISCIRNIYGQTEQSGLSATEPANEPRRHRTMGRPLDQILQWRVVETGTMPAPEPMTTTGELWVRGDAVTPGYWNSPQSTENRFVDDWFRTGDIVRADADGFLYFVERTDDMIISGGENVFPQMVENHLASSPLIAEVAVIGTSHERYVQQVTAIVVPVDGQTTADEIADWCREQPDLQGLQRPRRIEIVDKLPRMANSKVDRMALKRMFT
jgi:long-chain acyl-CoA synthetase